MSLLEIAIGILAVSGAVAATLHALLRRRNVHAVLWWLGVVWMFPILGSSLYYFFGINRLERKAARRRRSLPRSDNTRNLILSRAVDESTIAFDMRHLVSLARLVEGVVKLPLTRGNSVEPLFNGDQAYPAMLDAIDKAKFSVGLSTYIFDNDRAGTRFIQALSRAAARGVQVRVLIDDVGSGFRWRSVQSELAEKGVKVAYFAPTFAPWRIAYFNLRNHRKILTIDGSSAFSGGMNISEGHVMGLNPNHPAQDLHFKIKGPVVTQVQEVFRLDWCDATGEDLSGEAWFPTIEDAGILIARGIPDGPDEDFEKCKWTILGALAHAKRSIKIVTPYLIPDASLISALSLAAMSGVVVDIVLPQVNDMKLVSWATEAMLWQVLERGVRVWKTPPPFNHAKLMVVDGGWTLFGSTNWDPRSLRLNFEFNIECYDRSLANQMERYVEEKMLTAHQVTFNEITSRPFFVQLRDATARLFSPML